MTVKVTTPAGTTSTYGPYSSSDVGATDFSYTPTTVGNYTFVFTFPGQILAGANPPFGPGPYGSMNFQDIGNYYEPSTSSVVTLSVQQSPILPYPTTPLPTGYWQFPINAMNSNWQSIAGDWLMSGYNGLGNRYNPYTTAPSSAHLLWTYPVAAGGVAGAPTESTDATWNYYTGIAYEAKFNSPIIMDGNLIFNLPDSDNAGAGGAESINLRTGAVNWHISSAIAFGEELDFNSPNQYGIIPYLWGGAATQMFAAPGAAYTAYDPWTGAELFNISNVVSGLTGFGTGTMEFGPSGELITYVLGASGWIAMWNSTLDIMHYQNVMMGGNAWTWRPMTDTDMNWIYGVQWNNTVDTNYVGPGGQIGISAVTPNAILCTSGSIVTGQNWQWEVAYSAQNGDQLWAVNRTTAAGATDWALMGPADSTLYTEFDESAETWTAYSLTTGALLWGPTTPYTAAFGMYSWQASIAYGYLLGLDFGGYLHAFNLTNGKEAWSFYAGNSGIETAYGSWPLNNPPPTSADGEIFVVSGHAYNPPLFKGASIYCVNATNGNLIWKELGFYTYDPVEVADGVLVAYNCYDASVYCYGAGRSATTVSATPGDGNIMTIQGTVTDQSPGNTCLGIPAAGTPAIADASMSAWMAYLYMQQPEPMNATGVPVTLTYTDPNGNTYPMGTTTSDITGHYAYKFTPTLPGVYTITATFSGSNSYYSSSAETSFTYAAPPAATAAPTATPTSVANMYFVPAIAGLFVLIIIVAIVLALLMLRKKP
jgi:hypothetical protein